MSTEPANEDYAYANITTAEADEMEHEEEMSLSSIIPKVVICFHRNQNDNCHSVAHPSVCGFMLVAWYK